MAVNTEVAVKINVDVASAEKEVKSLTEEINKLKESLKNSSEGSDEYADNLKKLADAEKKLESAQNKLNDGLKENQKEAKKSQSANKGLMDVIKGLGIVSAISAGFDLFKEALMKNQKVADAVGAVMTTIQNVLGALVEVISNVITKVSESSNGFEALKKVVMGAVNLAFVPLKMTFYAIKLTIQEAQLAWEDSFFGDKDPKVIKDLNARITETKDNIKEVADNAVKSGKDIYNNFGEAVKSVGDVVSGVVEGASKINVKAIYDNSKTIIQLKNNAILAAAELQGLIEKYDRQAEKLRQIRDDDSNSIQDRIKANEELGNVLKEQSVAQLAQADKIIASAKADLAANKTSVELQKALTDAYNNRAGVLAQITGLESEQKVNAIALNKELLELNKLRSQSDIQLALDKRKADAELIKDELAKALELQKIREIERAAEIARLEENVANTKEGTQARLDAEIELKTKIQELQIAENAAQAEIDKIRNQRALDTKNAQIDNALAEYNLKKSLIDKERTDAFTKAQELIAIAKQESATLIEQINLKRDAEVAAAEAQGLSTIEIKQKYAIQEQQINNAIAQSEKDLAKAKVDATIQAADAIANTLQQTAQLLGEQTGVGKALAVISATISTITSAQKAYESTIGIPFVGPYLAPINAGLAIANGIKNVKKIMAVQVPNGGGAGGNVQMPTNSFAAGQTAPLTPQLQTTMLNQSQINQLGSATNRAFVLESDVSGNQERIRRLNRAARIN
jgi:DNA repair exonuclease SbcCD ATPase subunit